MHRRRKSKKRRSIFLASKTYLRYAKGEVTNPNVRSRSDGNPPDGEVAGPVIAGIFRLHVFDLPRLMPHYFAAAPGTTTQ